MKALITGSMGLVGSACVDLFTREGFEVVGIDNGARAVFFPESAQRLSTFPLDITDSARMYDLMDATRPDLIVHCPRTIWRRRYRSSISRRMRSAR